MTIILKDILNYDLFKRMLDEGYLRSQVHPKYSELAIFNYTEAAQFDRVWNDATNKCRGLILKLANGVLDENAEVVARPFNKFHNLNTEYAPETMEANLPNEAPLVTTKLDGSMGVVYFYDGAWCVATRGSFDSDQARWASAWYEQHQRSRRHDASWPADVTPVCEVIYAANRIVVDYDFEGLVVLSIIDNETGAELSRADVEQWAQLNGLPVVPKFDKTLAECAAENTANEEGYVLSYSNGVKVKVKFEEYVRLHRILTGLNPKTVWEMLSQGQSDAINKLTDDPKMPATFVAWLAAVATDLRVKYALIEAEAQAYFAARPASPARKDQAAYFVQSPHRAILFQMLDGKSYAETIWDRIKPKILRTFKKDGE
jgi:T4 RnlA family RNA ligase